MSGLAELELARINWAEFRDITGDAAGIESSLRRLLAAESPEDVKAVYWRLENYVVVQRTVYSSAEPTISVLMAAFLESRASSMKIASLNLIFEILMGLPHPDEMKWGNAGLIDRCRDRVREGLWLLIQEAVNGGVVRGAALDVIELVDEERAEQVRAWLGDQQV